MRKSRREILALSATAWGLAALRGPALFAQQLPRRNENIPGSNVRPVGLNQNGINSLDDRAFSITEKEQKMMDDYLAGRDGVAHQDLQQIDFQVTAIEQNPPRIQAQFIQDFRFETQQIHGDWRMCAHRRINPHLLHRCIDHIDQFVTHWFPCNTIYAIGRCEIGLGRCLQRRDWLATTEYAYHLQKELFFMFRYHDGAINFHQQSGLLLQRLDDFCGLIQGHANWNTIQTEYHQFAQVTEVFFRRHYVRWC